MGTVEEFRERWRREQQLRERLRLAAFRLEAAEVKRVWAVLSAHQQGLSFRNIAAAVGLSRARVHQLLREPAAGDVPAHLNALRERGWPVAAPATGEADEAAGGATGRPLPRPGWPRRWGHCASASTGWSSSTGTSQWW